MKTLPNENTSGLYNWKKKSITLNSNILKKDLEYCDYLVILETLTHESYHAMNDNQYGNDRTFYSNENDIIYNDGIKEIFTEKEADRTILNRNPNYAYNYYSPTFGYDNTTCYTNIIAAAYGIKEKELLQAAIKGNKEFIDVLYKNIKDKNLAQKCYEDISLNINLLHIDIYNKELDDNKVDNIIDANKFIYNLSEVLLNTRIRELDENNIEDLPQKLEDIMLNQNAITQMLENRFTYDKDREKILELCKYNKQLIYTKILSINEIIKNHNTNPQLINFVKNQVSIEKILELCNKNNIEIDIDAINKLPQFKLSDKKQQDWIKEYCLDGEEWDNNEIINYISKHQNEIKSVRKRFDIKNIFNNFINRFSNKKQELLLERCCNNK